MSDFADKSAGVCTPAAVTNLLYYWGFKRGCSIVITQKDVAAQSAPFGKAYAIYKIVYGAMNTSDEHGTGDAITNNAFIVFLDSTPTSGLWNLSKLSNGSSFEAYKSAFNDNCPILLAVKNGDLNNPDTKGH